MEDSEKLRLKEVCSGRVVWPLAPSSTWRVQTGCCVPRAHPHGAPSQAWSCWWQTQALQRVLPQVEGAQLPCSGVHPGVPAWAVPLCLAPTSTLWGPFPRDVCLPGQGLRGVAGEPAPHSWQVEHMTRHLEESERAMQERLQRLEALKLSLEEVSPRGLRQAPARGWMRGGSSCCARSWDPGAHLPGFSPMAQKGPWARAEWASRWLSVQELSRVKAAALSERGQAEEELIKARNQARLEQVRHGHRCAWLIAVPCKAWGMMSHWECD